MHLTGVDVKCMSAWAGLVNIQPFIALGRLDESPHKWFVFQKILSVEEL